MQRVQRPQRLVSCLATGIVLFLFLNTCSTRATLSPTPTVFAPKTTSTPTRQAEPTAISTPTEVALAPATLTATATTPPTHTPEPTNTPEPTSAPEPTETPEPPPTAAPIRSEPAILPPPTPEAAVGRLDIAEPFFAEALKLRSRRRTAEPNLANRIDERLNENRISFLLLGCGETYEPPLAVDYICSPTHIVLERRRFANGATRVFYTTFSYTHDLRAPEIERYRGEKPGHKNPVKIDQVFRSRKFEHVREVFENASGLYIDFPLVIEDVLIQRYVDQVPGTLTVYAPWELKTLPIYISAKRHDGQTYPPGKNVLNGWQTLQFLKGLEPTADKRKEPNRRKDIVMKALLGTLDANKTDVGFWARNTAFFVNLGVNPNAYGLYYDVDVLAMTLQIVQRAVTNLNERIAMPVSQANYYIVDSATGDGGVLWINASPSPIIQKEIADGVYQKTTTAFEVPSGAFVNPYADDLISGYWRSVREFIKVRLMRPAS